MASHHNQSIPCYKYLINVTNSKKNVCYNLLQDMLKNTMLSDDQVEWWASICREVLQKLALLCEDTAGNRQLRICPALFMFRLTFFQSCRF